MSLMQMARRAGFSLVEVIVALVVFVLVIGGLSSVFVSASRIIIHNRERMTSAQLGKFFLDPLQAHVRQDNWLNAGPGNALAIGGPWSGVTQSINNVSFSETHTVSAVTSTDLRRVIATISWTELST